MAKQKDAFKLPGGEQMRRDLQEDKVDLLLDVGSEADWIRSAKVRRYRERKKHGKKQLKNK